MVLQMVVEFFYMSGRIFLLQQLNDLIAIVNKPIASFLMEINLHNDALLRNCSYNPSKSLVGNHLDAFSKYLFIFLNI